MSSQLLIEQINYLAGHKSMAMTKRYDHANEERYGAAIEALDAAGKTSSAEALAAASTAGSGGEAGCVAAQRKRTLGPARCEGHQVETRELLALYSRGSLVDPSRIN